MMLSAVMVNKCAALIVVLVCILAFAFGNCLARQDPNAGASPEWSIGNRNAPVVIEVFNDYQCRPCATFNKELKRVHEKYVDRVRIVFRNFPITDTHEKALLAAQTAEAAGLQGKFFEMIDLLYANARQWAESKNAKKLFISYARDLKLEQKRFRTDMSGDEVRERIRLDVERARFLNVPGTPTIVINGELIQHEDLANLDSEIDTRLVPKNTSP
jgi:protein-disulfide isomerase